MGARISLPEGTKLNFKNHDKGKMTYVIRGEIGRGASCIAYDGYYINNSGISKSVRIKECYPYKLKITRDVSGHLAVDESGESVFEEYKSKMRESFVISNELFEARGITNSISNSFDLYEANHTLYIVSAYLEGTSISCEMFDSLKDAVSVVKSTADTIKKIHDKGYLYLDIKPDNIYVLNGTTQIIQLYDFDSLIPVDQKNEFDKYKIRYTEGFAALEQRMGRLSGIGKYTDVYGIGALLYYLIFGKTPDASVCDTDAEFIFTEKECVETGRHVDSVSRYARNTYNDKLYVKLTDFFHHTIVSYASDRYQDMKEVIERLTEIESYADLALPFICNSYIPEHIDMIGRNDEEEYLNQWYSDRGRKCLFVTGMGGMGKSTLVRGWISRNIYKDSYSQQELCYSVKNEIRFDTVLYLYYNDSIQRMIGDDRQFCINTLEKIKEESYSDYFRRKLICLRKITEKTNTLLVIDNFDGAVEKDFFELLDVNWKMIVITRNFSYINEFETLNIGAIKTREGLYRLFGKNLGRAVEEDEKSYLDEIIENVHGHTLILELIARQIAKSYLTLRKACELVRTHGFSHFAAEKINYIKDGQSYYDRLSNIITVLFPVEQMSIKKKSLLKILSLFDMSGTDISTFEEILNLESKDDINELIEEGWTNIDNKTIHLHPVIRETICQWEWTEDYKKLAKYMLNYVCKQIKLEGKKTVETDQKVLDQYLRVSENILDNIKREKDLNSLGEYLELLYYTIINMPPDKEEYIAAHAEEIFHNPDVNNMKAIIKLFDYVVYIYCEKGELDLAFDKIREAGKIVTKQNNHYLWGLYYSMKGNYYDALLGGGYFVQNEEEKEILRLLLDTVNKSIRHMRKSREPDSGQYLAKYILSKVNILTRSYPKKKKISKLLDKVHILIEKNTLDYSSIRMNFYITCAWYYTLVEPDWTLTEKYSLEAWKIAKEASLSDIEMIDSVIVPRANIYVEWNRKHVSAATLDEGIKICGHRRYRNLLPYIRKKMELYEHLLDLYFFMGDYDKCREVIETIDRENSKNKETGIVKEIPETLRQEVFSK